MWKCQHRRVYRRPKWQISKWQHSCKESVKCKSVRCHRVQKTELYVKVTFVKSVNTTGQLKIQSDSNIRIKSHHDNFTYFKVTVTLGKKVLNVRCHSVYKELYTRLGGFILKWHLPKVYTTIEFIPLNRLKLPAQTISVNMTHSNSIYSLKSQFFLNITTRYLINKHYYYLKGNCTLDNNKQNKLN